MIFVIVFFARKLHGNTTIVVAPPAALDQRHRVHGRRAGLDISENRCDYDGLAVVVMFYDFRLVRSDRIFDVGRTRARLRFRLVRFIDRLGLRFRTNGFRRLRLGFAHQQNARSFARNLRSLAVVVFTRRLDHALLAPLEGLVGGDGTVFIQVAVFDLQALSEIIRKDAVVDAASNFDRGFVGRRRMR